MRVEPAPLKKPRARACVLTPKGRGAIAVIRIWGSDALLVADQVFRPAQGPPLARTRPGQPRYGRAGDATGDEVVALILPHPNQPDLLDVEFQCHGGASAINLVMAALEAAGAERRQPVAWVRHAAASPIQAEAEVDLAQAQTLKTAEILLEQAQGALERDVRQALSQIHTSIPRCIDHLRELVQRSETGLRLLSGWRVVLSGRPNVGKSQLLNALAGYERAIVSPTPGTTRDVVTLRTALNGWPVELSDTAGLRESLDLIESSGVTRAHSTRQAADLVLLVLDGSEPLTDADRGWIETWTDALIVRNKSDLPPDRGGDWPPALLVSAVQADGLEELGSAITQRLGSTTLPPGGGVPFRPRHVRHLQAALHALEGQKVDEVESQLHSLING